MAPPEYRPPLSEIFNKMVGKPLNEAVFNAQAQKEGFDPRIIPPGMKVSKEFKTDRIIARVDDKNIVTRIYFG